MVQPTLPSVHCYVTQVVVSETFAQKYWENDSKCHSRLGTSCSCFRELWEHVTATWNIALFRVKLAAECLCMCTRHISIHFLSLCQTEWNGQILGLFEYKECESRRWISKQNLSTFYSNVNFAFGALKQWWQLHCFVSDWLLFTRENSVAYQKVTRIT